MTTTAIRKRLMTYLADAGDNKIKALYTLLQSEIEEASDFSLNEKHIAILDAEREKHIVGKSKSYNRTEAKALIKKKRA